MTKNKPAREASVVTLGETMLRVSPEKVGERFQNAIQFRVEPGGSESNVAIALAHLGHKVRHLTRVPEDALGDIVVRHVKAAGVSAEHIYRSVGRIGCYWTEMGVGPRPSKVIYDRSESLFSNWLPDEVDWDRLFDDVGWFHTSGINPALNQRSADFLNYAFDSVPQNVIKSLDLNYRTTLWKYLTKNRQQTIYRIMSGFCARSDYVFGNETDFQDCLGLRFRPDANNCERYETLASGFFEKFEKPQGIAISLRGSHSASDNTWSGVFFIRKEKGFDIFEGPSFRIHPIVDRLGAGDSFSAGMIHGLKRFQEAPQDIINFAIALGALKHTIRGDACFVNEEDVRGILASKGVGKVIR